MKLQDLHEMITEYWKLIKVLWVIENNDAYWEKVIGSLARFAENHGNKPFPRALALALSDELERRYKCER